MSLSMAVSPMVWRKRMLPVVAVLPVCGRRMLPVYGCFSHDPERKRRMLPVVSSTFNAGQESEECASTKGYSLGCEELSTMLSPPSVDDLLSSVQTHDNTVGEEANSEKRTLTLLNTTTRVVVTFLHGTARPTVIQ